MKLVLVTVLLGMLAVTAAAQLPAPKPIFDARLTLKPNSPTVQERDLLTGRIAPAVRKYWQEDERAGPCRRTQELDAIDVASGAFTHQRAQQRAILYRYCEIGHNRNLQGIAIVEGGKTVAHLAFEGAATAIGALPDIDGNGVAEIVIASGGTNMGETWGAIAIVELAGREVTAFGRTRTLSDNCGAVEQGCRGEAKRILTRPGVEPAFLGETFTRAGDAGPWKKRSEAVPLTLEKDETEYELLH